MRRRAADGAPAAATTAPAERAAASGERLSRQYLSAAASADPYPEDAEPPAEAECGLEGLVLSAYGSG